MNENKKSNVWLYAVILFTSAFIVLLFAGLSQIKMNKNLSDYKSQVYHTESEKNKYQQNFTSAQEMNEKLNEQIQKLEEENLTLKEEIREMRNEKEILDAYIKDKDEAEENFHSVLTAYLKGNVIEAAGLLSSVDQRNFWGKSLEAYNILDQQVKSEAGKLLFDEGYALYNRAKYAEAAEKLFLSFGYAKKETFSDKCLYYLAWAEKKSGSKIAALAHMEQLIADYPESIYVRYARNFINRYK